MAHLPQNLYFFKKKKQGKYKRKVLKHKLKMENHIKRGGDSYTKYFDYYYYVLLCSSTTHFPQTPFSLPYGVLFSSHIHIFKNKNKPKYPLLCKWETLKIGIFIFILFLYFLEFLGVLFGGFWFLKKNMKRDSVNFDQSHVVDDEAKAKVKYQSLLKEYLELQKVFVSKKRKLQTTKQKRETMLAEVRFLRRRHKYLLKIRASITGKDPLRLQDTENGAFEGEINQRSPAAAAESSNPISNSHFVMKLV